MNPNKLRHRVLGILSAQSLIAEDSTSERMQVKFEKICKELKCNPSAIKLAIAELYVNKEIANIDVFVMDDLYSTPKGDAAFSSKKYLGIHRTNIFNTIKDWMQVTIPVLSLFIAVIAIYAKVDGMNESSIIKLHEVEKRIEALEKYEVIEKNVIKNLGADSLKIK